MNYILSNIFFGQPKMTKYQFEYFEEYFIPFIKKKSTSEDKIVIVGDIFYNTTTINFSLLSKVKSIFEKLSIIPIEIVGNNYCFDIIEKFSLDKPITKIETNFYNDIKTNLFDSKGNENLIGFNAIRDVNIKFVENKKSPRFIEYKINSIEDLDNIVMDNNFIDLIIDGELIEKSEFKNKIDIFLSKNNFNNVFYTEKQKESTIIVKNNNIREVIMDNIEEDLKEEMLNIFKLCDQ